MIRLQRWLIAAMGLLSLLLLVKWLVLPRQSMTDAFSVSETLELTSHRRRGSNQIITYEKITDPKRTKIEVIEYQRVR